jgi:hypothetical protein
MPRQRADAVAQLHKLENGVFAFPSAAFESLGNADGLMGLFDQIEKMFESDNVGAQDPKPVDTAVVVNPWDMFRGLLPAQLATSGTPKSEVEKRVDGAEKDIQSYFFVPQAAPRPVDEVRREMDFPTKQDMPAIAGETGLKSAMRRLFNTDAHNMQILLIVSIIACLFAVVWLLLNSSNDPIVQVNNPKGEDNMPPAYETLMVGDMDKKNMPFLIVAGMDEQAPPLPTKGAPEDMPTSII